MRIELSNIGKKYNHDWIFRKVGIHMEAGQAYAILGSNGSGKSTLLQIISGRTMPTEGSLIYYQGVNLITQEEVFRKLSLATPYQELIEEFTIKEMLQLHCRLKALLPGMDYNGFIEILGFRRTENKAIRYFSSGMKQRLKLALALLSDVPLVLLDEPCSNLDKQGVKWYRGLVETYGRERLLVVCSNHLEEEIAFCRHSLNVNDYK